MDGEGGGNVVCGEGQGYVIVRALGHRLSYCSVRIWCVCVWGGGASYHMIEATMAPATRQSPSSTHSNARKNRTPNRSQRLYPIVATAARVQVT